MVKTWTEEAEEKGVLKGKRALLWSLVKGQFPNVSEKACRRLAEWPAERLEELGLALFKAQSLHELGLED